MKAGNIIQINIKGAYGASYNGQTAKIIGLPSDRVVILMVAGYPLRLPRDDVKAVKPE